MPKSMKVHLVIIDPQKDFMNDQDSSLPVPGANMDMNNVARLLARIGKKVTDIQVTLDSHRVIDVGHPGMWRNEHGDPPPPFTMISPDDMKSGIWRPRNEHARFSDLGGKTLGAYMYGYAQDLAARGNYPLMVWPEHCVIGTNGHSIQANLMEMLLEWERREFASVNYVVKGANPFTEHYGALMAEVPLPSDPSTDLNTDFLRVVADADIVALMGEALSHCVKSTVTQIADNVGEEQIKKFHILTDCSSPVPAVHGGPDFPAIANAWLHEMEARGMHLTTSDRFLA